MTYYQDLRSFVDALEQRGLVYRIRLPIHKDHELVPFYRVELRGLAESERKALLFEDVRGASGTRYSMRVLVGAYGVSERITALGMGCESSEETPEKWHGALERPVPPEIVDDGPVHEEVHLGDELLECGLDEIPAPVEEPGYSQVIRTGLPMITRDPETGIRNVGTYNGFFRDRNRIAAGIGFGQHAMRHHWQAARRRGEDLPIAIAVGTTPNVMMVGCARIPYGIDELAVAGGIAGEPVQLVRCKTVPLEVPAHAEIVIEGMLSTRLLEPRYAFGEYPGYMNNDHNSVPVLQVTAITHRRDAIFTPVLVGFYPSDTNTINMVANAGVLYHTLRYGCGLPLEEVHFLEAAGGTDFCVLRLRQGASAQAWQVLQTAAGLWSLGKYFLAVDYDINPQEPDLLLWAMAFRVRPERDLAVVPGRQAGLDPASVTHGPLRSSPRSAWNPGENFRVLLDATTKGVYPPVALPKRGYMERALELWREAELPEPSLKTPWYGYDLGAWTEEDQKLADLIAAGDYRAVGRIAEQAQKNVEDVLS